MKAFAQQYPSIKFAITDDPVSAVGGLKNEEGITYATEQGGCLVGVLAAKMAQSMGKKIIGVAGGQEIPPVDTYIAGYKFCARKAVKGTKVLVQYSNDFADVAKCSTIAQNEIGQGAQVIFQVAGPCGDGALKEASALGKWGIGVDADEYNVAKHILTSALKQTGTGVYDTVVAAAQGHFKAGKNLVFNLNNKGVEGVYRFLGRVWRLFVQEESETEFEQKLTTAAENGAALLEEVRLSGAITDTAPTPGSRPARSIAVRATSPPSVAVGVR